MEIKPVIINLSRKDLTPIGLVEIKVEDVSLSDADSKLFDQTVSVQAYPFLYKLLANSVIDISTVREFIKYKKSKSTERITKLDLINALREDKDLKIELEDLSKSFKSKDELIDSIASILFQSKDQKEASIASQMYITLIGKKRFATDVLLRYLLFGQNFASNSFLLDFFKAQKHNKQIDLLEKADFSIVNETEESLRVLIRKLDPVVVVRGLVKNSLNQLKREEKIKAEEYDCNVHSSILTEEIDEENSTSPRDLSAITKSQEMALMAIGLLVDYASAEEISKMFANDIKTLYDTSIEYHHTQAASMLITRFHPDAESIIEGELEKAIHNSKDFNSIKCFYAIENHINLALAKDGDSLSKVEEKLGEIISSCKDPFIVNKACYTLINNFDDAKDFLSNLMIGDIANEKPSLPLAFIIQMLTLPGDENQNNATEICLSVFNDFMSYRYDKSNKINHALSSVMDVELTQICSTNEGIICFNPEKKKRPDLLFLLINMLVLDNLISMAVISDDELELSQELFMGRRENILSMLELASERYPDIISSIIKADEVRDMNSIGNSKNRILAGLEYLSTVLKGSEEFKFADH